ncbi:nucleotide-diphospho-sugar transferase [Macrophomina phaseolina]|uniref:Nucleotide-diphospho-sugar transferase n=1 Tax=Macrophomina phaseolina TaxID=35725 RepID=A0ABQ8FS91_9PEZI|nr:nucleotide-diphospho-sugar transferase [Macrophomina phaseolina]
MHCATSQRFSSWRRYAKSVKVASLACILLTIIWHSHACEKLFSRDESLNDFPKKIWQLSLYSSNDKREFTTNFSTEWQAKNPDYRYECLRDQAIDTFVLDTYRNDRRIRKAFDTIRHDPILQADFVRYLILLREGGIYADLDTRPQKSINDWIPSEYQDQTNIVIGVEIDKGRGQLWRDSPWTVQMSQFTIMAKANHPIIQRVVDNACRNIELFFNSTTDSNGSYFHISFDQVITLTGPKVFTAAVFQYLSQRMGAEMNGDEVSELNQPILLADVLILPVNGFASGQVHSNSGSPEDSTALVQHSWMGSWVSTHPHESSLLSYTD